MPCGGQPMLSLLLTTLLPALLPVVIDGAKGVVSKVTDNAAAKPTNFSETLEYEKFLLEKLKTLADIDKPAGNISMWVSDLRGSIRYIAIILILMIYGAVTLANLPMGTQEYELLAQLTSACVFFLLGERVYMNLRSAK